MMTPQTLLLLALLFVSINFLLLPYLRKKCINFFSLKLARKKTTSYAELKVIAWITALTGLVAFVTLALTFKNIGVILADYPAYISTMASYAWMALITTWLVIFAIKTWPLVLKVRFAKTSQEA